MPTPQHQWLLLWTARKMEHDGYMVRGFDGTSPQGGDWNRLPKPFLLTGLRPDVWAISKLGRLAFGEAKTADDIASAHTRAQLRTFGRVQQADAIDLCPLYIAVPRSAAHLLDKALGSLGLAGRSHIRRIHVPDCLLESSLDECA